MDKNYTDINSKAVDQWVESGWEWGIPISHEEYIAAANGTWRVFLTPQKPVPQEWLSPFMANGRLDGVRLLGLASGGAQQMPVFSALGAACTVFDNSQRQLDSEKLVAQREGYSIDIIKGDMTLKLPFEDEAFGIIFHPVSNCYIEDVHHVWRECYRVLKKGGILLAGVDNGLNYLFEEDQPLLVVNKLPYNPLKNKLIYEKCIKDGSIQFSHTIEDQIGGQLKAGFALADLYEDTDNTGIGEYAPNFLATKAVKT